MIEEKMYTVEEERYNIYISEYIFLNHLIKTKTTVTTSDLHTALFHLFSIDSLKPLCKALSFFKIWIYIRYI